jgi:hypothetical protein
VFVGQDNKHYGSVWTAGLFAPTGPVPAGMVQVQAFGPSAATITTNGNDAYAAYAGDDEHVYYVWKTGPGGSWAASSQVPSGLVKNALPPAIVLDGAGKVYFFFVRKVDAKVAFVTLTTPQMTWSAETLVDANALTQGAVTATRTSTGDVLVAWHGYNDEGLYFARGERSRVLRPGCHRAARRGEHTASRRVRRGGGRRRGALWRRGQIRPDTRG